MTSPARFVVVLSVLLSLGACSGKADVASEQSGAGNQRVFSADDKRIARLLSIGETGVKAGGSPQDQALLCDIALQSIADRLRQSGALSAVQMGAFDKAQSLYRTRAAAGRTPAQLASARSAMETAHPEASERARLAIGCLRDLS